MEYIGFEVFEHILRMNWLSWRTILNFRTVKYHFRCGVDGANIKWNAVPDLSPRFYEMMHHVRGWF